MKNILLRFFRRKNALRDLKRGMVMFGCPAAIIWLGSGATSHISELYDGLCVLQGPGMAELLYDNNKLGYCTGISEYISTLGIIMGIAAIAVPSAFAI